jgi:hypothetical protein
MMDKPALMDYLISIPEERRNGVAVLAAICQQLSKRSGRRVLLGTVPFNSFDAYQDLIAWASPNI